MKAVLLMRSSEPQIYCANTLRRSGCLDAVVLEGGSSLATEKADLARIARAALRLPKLAGSPAKVAHRLRYAVNRARYYGNRQLHHLRILSSDFSELTPELSVARVASVGDPECAQWLAGFAPDLVFVFGTGIIGERLLAALPCPAVNMHWGWAPDFRGEGIVSALAHGGPDALGVTVHLLDRTIDGGEILYRERPVIDESDNFYSIGLKLTLLGTRLFERVYRDCAGGAKLRGTPQRLEEGKLFDSAYMAAHPQLFTRAWKNLARGQERESA